MPELEAVIEKVVEAKTGTSARGDWTLWHVFDKNETKFATFNRAHYDAAHNGIGKRFKLTYTENDKGKTLQEIAGPLAGVEETPAPATGKYIKGKTNPDDERSINARRALQDAVAAMTHTIPSGVTPKVAWQKHIGPMYEAMKLALNEQSGIATEDDATDDDVPF